MPSYTKRNTLLEPNLRGESIAASRCPLLLIQPEHPPVTRHSCTVNSTRIRSVHVVITGLRQGCQHGLPIWARPQLVLLVVFATSWQKIAEPNKAVRRTRGQPPLQGLRSCSLLPSSEPSLNEPARPTQHIRRNRGPNPVFHVGRRRTPDTFPPHLIIITTHSRSNTRQLF